MHRMLYLVNNKDYEPDLPAHVRRVADEYGAAFQELDVENLSFFCPRDAKEQIEVYNGIKPLEIRENDYFFVRKWHPNSPATILLTTILRHRGIPYTDQAMSLQHTALQSKLTQPFQLKGVAAFPDTWVATAESFELNKDHMLRTLAFPVVLKLKGAESKRVWKCDTAEALAQKFHEVRERYPAKLIMLQEYIPNDSDIRVLVWRDRVLAALRRTSTDGFLNNAQKGSGITPIELTDEEASLARAATRTLEFELSGVDIVRSAHGPLLFEVNKTPDIAQYNEAAGRNLEEQIAEDMLSDT